MSKWLSLNRKRRVEGEWLARSIGSDLDGVIQIHHVLVHSVYTHILVVRVWLGMFGLFVIRLLVVRTLEKVIGWERCSQVADWKWRWRDLDPLSWGLG